MDLNNFNSNNFNNMFDWQKRIGSIFRKIFWGVMISILVVCIFAIAVQAYFLSSFGFGNGFPFSQSGSGSGQSSTQAVDKLMGLNIGGVKFDETNLESSSDLPGDAKSFDPIATFDQVQKFAGAGAQLIGMEMRYVGSDGKLDLPADYRPTVDYKFIVDVKNPPKEAPPVGAGRRPGSKWYQKINVTASNPGGTISIRTFSTVSLRYTVVNKGLVRDPDSADYDVPPKVLDKPSCSLADFWKVAIAKGAPTDAVARIEYTSYGYEFNISDIDIHIRFSSDCKEMKPDKYGRYL